VAKIALDRARIAAFCERHNIARMSLFGSVLRDDFGPESDVDVLVEFVPGKGPGFFELVEMEYEFAELLGTAHKVDLRTPHELSKYFREEVVAGAEMLYAAA